jgi:surface polysaccharide O-acyltransferase-like enzyme
LFDLIHQNEMKMTNILPAIQPRNQSVDTFRFLAALGVIILHVEYPNVPNEIVIGLRLISRWAIPFFFIFGGYFLAANNTKVDRLDVQPAIERLIRVFLIWSLIYALVVIYQHDINTSIKRIVSPYFIYFGNFVHLWFIPSLIFGYLFVAFCYNFNLKNLLAILSIIAIVIALLSGAYAVIDLGIPLNFDIARNWLAIPFLYIGFLLYKKGYPSWWVSTLLIIFGAGLQIFEAKFLYDKFGSSPYEHQFLIGTIPFAVGMAGLALSDLKFLKYSVFSNWGKEYSLGIYLIHPLLAIVVLKLMEPFTPGFLGSPIWQIFFPLVLIAVSLLFLRLVHLYLPSGFNTLFGKRPAKKLNQ